jgi:hypothetical protein
VGEVRVSEKHKYVFVSTPKAASQSLYRVLGEWYGPVRGYGMHGVKVPKQFKDYFTWTVVRNPYTRAISQWWHSVGSGSRRPNGKKHIPELELGMPFPDYIQWLTSPNQNPQPSGPGRRHVENQGWRLSQYRQDRVIYFENLETEFMALPFAEEGKPPWFPLVNTNLWHASLGGSQPPPINSLFTPELASLVYNWETSVFEKFGYPRCSWETL